MICAALQHYRGIAAVLSMHPQVFRDEMRMLLHATI
jgi:hypothetical protein